MRTALRIGTLLFSATTLIGVSAQNYFGVVSPDLGSGRVDVIDINTGAVSNSTTALLNGAAFDGFTGIARDPITGTVYVTVKDGQVIKLAQLNTQTQALTLIATLTEKIASITHANGQLYGISGDGGNDPERLYIINTTTGALSNVIAPGTGSDGEAIAFNTSDGLIYRYGGGSVFQSINPANLNVVNIGLSYTPDNYAHGMVYEAATNTFLFSAGDSLYTLSTSGGLTLRASFNGSDSGYKGFLSTVFSSVEEVDEAASFTVFPNPAQDALEIVVNSPEIRTLQVFNTTGALVDEQPITGVGPMRYGLTDLANGNYTFVLIGGQQRLVRTVSVKR